MPDSVFWHYNTTFDPIELIRRFAVHDQIPTPGLVTNYFGVLIDPAYYPSVLTSMVGSIEMETIPANWHADIAEFGAALRAVELSGDRFTMIELGCGWGCWMNIAGGSARRHARTVHLIGVEGDESHAEWGRQSMARNGFSDDEYTLYRGIAAARTGTALFPRTDDSGTWGAAPIFGATDTQRERAIAMGTHDVLEMLPLAAIAADHGRIDLLHIDIQGGEADLIAGSLDFLREKVAYLVIGTHSREIEGRLFELLSGKGWKLEIERPLIFNMAIEPPTSEIDGVQGWRNLSLSPL